MKHSFVLVMVVASLASAAPRTVEGLMSKFDAGLAAKSYLPTGDGWAKFSAEGGKKKLTFEAKKGRCYKLVVLADLDDQGVVNNDTHARWGPLEFQKVKGERKLMDGDALFDLGCTLTAVTFQTPLREKMSIDLELRALETGTPSFTARLYAKDAGEAEVNAVWAKLVQQDEIDRRSEEGIRERCAKWRARFDSCVKGKRPADYLRGASCRDAAEHERAGYGAAVCGAL